MLHLSCMYLLRFRPKSEHIIITMASNNNKKKKQQKQRNIVDTIGVNVKPDV